MPIIGKLECFAPGHKLNQKLLKEILIDKKNYEIVNQTDTNETDGFYNLLVNDITSK